MRDSSEDNFLEQLPSPLARRSCPDNHSLVALVEGREGRLRSEAFANHKKTCSACRELELRLCQFQRAEAIADYRWLTLRGSVRAAIASRIREQVANAGAPPIAAAVIQPSSNRCLLNPLVWIPAGVLAVLLPVFIELGVCRLHGSVQTQVKATEPLPQASISRKTDGSDTAEIVLKEASAEPEIQRLRSRSDETGDPESIRIESNSSIFIRIISKTPQSDGGFSFDADVLESDSSSNLPDGTQFSGVAAERNGWVDFSISEMRHHRVRYVNRNRKIAVAQAATSDGGTNYRLIALIPSVFDRVR